MLPSDILVTPEQILSWRLRQRSLSGFRYERIPLSLARRWSLERGQIVHDTGRFFGIVGITARSPVAHLDGLSQPIIAQPEIGTLGFLLRRNGHECDILVQAKTEPGNVGATQLAPTVQATLSNQDRLHEGTATAYIEHFVGKDTTGTVSDQLQSEQGTRFLSKYNRNVTCVVAGSGPAPVDSSWRWCSARALLALLHHDYVLNTDARSVLVCGPWEMLGQSGSPFSIWRGADNFGAALLQSYESSETVHSLEGLLQRLQHAREVAPVQLAHVPVEKIAGWTFDDEGISDDGRMHFRVGYHRVRTLDREVAEWDQPLVADFHPIDVVLICQRRRGILHFLLRHAAEIGFREGVQFGPTLQMSAADAPARDEMQSRIASLVAHAKTHVDTWASDEGGRFDHNRVRYRIVELCPDIPCEDGPSGSWAGLGQVRSLLARQGALTNEARSALSLLLPFLWRDASTA